MRRRIIQSVFFWGSAAFVTVASSPQSAFGQNALTKLTELHEKYSDGVNLSGSLLVGIGQGGSINGPLDLEKLSVALPRVTTHKELCLEMTTRDGRYFGEQAFEISSLGPSVQRLALKSQYAEKLRSYSANDLAPRFELRDKCDEGKSGTLVVASLSEGVEPGKLMVFVNTKSSDAKVTILNAKDEVLKAESCIEFSAGAKTAFDRVCRLDISDADRVAATKLTLRVVGLTGSYRDYSYAIALEPVK